MSSPKQHLGVQMGVISKLCSLYTHQCVVVQSCCSWRTKLAKQWVLNLLIWRSIWRHHLAVTFLEDNDIVNSMCLAGCCSVVCKVQFEWQI